MFSSMTRLLMREEKRSPPPHMMAWHAWLTLLCMVLLCAGAQAGCLDPKRLVGVNLSGAEFGHDRLPGQLNKDYVYPSRKDLAYFRGLKMNVIRVPFRWERLQRQVNAALDPSELAQLRQVVAWATELDLCVLLDLHNFGAYHGRILGTTALPASAFADVWLRLSKEFDQPDQVAFGLMNEPASQPVAQWMAIAQQTVLALREAGAKNLLLVSSGRWSGAHEWATKFDGASAATGFRNFRDPLNNFAFEVHQYADADYSGTGSTCIDPARLSALMASITAWAKQEKKRLFLGEFGVASSSECLAALKTLLESVQDADAWLGWAYWSAGPWWGNYPFSIQPGDGEAAPQTNVLRAFLPG
jgi:endoglucanase